MDWTNVPEFDLKPSALNEGIDLYRWDDHTKISATIAHSVNGGWKITSRKYDGSSAGDKGALQSSGEANTVMGSGTGYVGGAETCLSVKQGQFGGGLGSTTAPLVVTNTGTIRFNVLSKTEQDSILAGDGPGVLTVNSNPISTVVFSATAPATPVVGQIWVQTA